MMFIAKLVSPPRYLVMTVHRAQQILLHTIMPVIWVYVFYLVFAKIGVFLVMPPGQASIMWLAAGVGLASVCIYGHKAALGIFLAALTNSLGYYTEIGIAEILTASSIGFGAALQAVIGRFLAKAFYTKTYLLGHLKDVLAFMVLGGPVACITNAVIASFALLQAGKISADYFWSHSFSWWVGDAFGVIVFAPVMLLLFSRPVEGHALSLKRKLMVAAPMILALGAFVVLFGVAKSKLTREAYQNYRSETVEIVNEFKQGIAVKVSSIRAVAAFFNASEYVSADEFEIFTAPLLQGSTGLYGLSWLPKVERQDRRGFVESIKRQGFPDYKICSRAEDGSLMVSGEQDVYYPLAYTEPYELNKQAHGFDVYGVDGVSGDVRKQILDGARDCGEVRATNRFSIVQKQDEYGFIMYFPVYSSMKDGSLAERRAHHLGYINGIFTFPSLIKPLLEKFKEVDSDVILEDVSDEEVTILFDSRTSDFKEGAEAIYDLNSQVYTSDEISVAGRTWNMILVRHKPLLTPNYIHTLWAYVIGGMVFNVFLLLILTTITARADYVENLVEEKTQELRHANAELEEFAYRTSHDLRSPLVSSIAVLKIAGESISGDNKERAEKSIVLAQDSLQKLETLVQDILALTKTKNVGEDTKKIDFKNIVDEAIAKFTHMDHFDRLDISINLGFRGLLVSQESRVKLIVENLISNAIKYQDLEEERSFIKISTKGQGSNVILTIEDNGIGVPKDKQSKLFTMFGRFHPQISFGSGLGLYMMAKSVDILGGDIEYKDPGKGSIFEVSIPLN